MDILEDLFVSIGGHASSGVFGLASSSTKLIVLITSSGTMIKLACSLLPLVLENTEMCRVILFLAGRVALELYIPHFLYA